MSLRICWLVISMTSKPQFGGEKVKLSDLCSKGKSSLRQKDLLNDGPYLVYGASGVIGTMSCYQNEEPYVAVVKDGAGVGRVMACKGKSSVLGTMQALLPSKNVDLNYLLHLVRSLKLGDDFSGSTIPHIYFRDYGEREVPAIAIKQQIMIAGVLDKIEMMLARLDMTLKKQDQLVKSRFVEMFGDIDEWHSANMSEVCSIITDGTHQPPKFVSEGIPFLFVSNIAGNVLTYETTKYVSEADYEILIKRTPIEVGDVLVSAVGSFGHPAVVRRSRPFCFQRHIAYLKPKRELIDSDYLHAVLLTDKAQRYMDKVAKGVAQRTVTLKSFKEMMIPLPPLELQQEFADFVAQVDKSGFAVRKQIKKLQLLYDSLAQEYFGD